MKISQYYGSNALSNSGRGSVSSSSSSVSANTSNSASNQNKSADTASVINKVSCNVYDAVDDFLYLSKDSDRLESYNNLASQDKEKFLQVVSKMRDDGTLSESKLNVRDESSGKTMKSILRDYTLYSAKNYTGSGDTVSLTAIQG